MPQGKHRYMCGTCGTETKTIAKGEPTRIRTGCDFCEKITTYLAMGTIPYYDRMHALAEARR